MLNEIALRKPGFSEGRKVVLADGQAWTFPRPKIRLKPRIVDGKVEIGGGPSFGPEYDEQLDVLFGVTDVDPAERLRVKFEVAVRLLAANYNLRPDELAELIVLEPGDPASDGAPGPALQRDHGYRPKTFARYLRLCARMAGETEEIELEDAIGIASFLVAMRRVPPVTHGSTAWWTLYCDSMEAFF